MGFSLLVLRQIISQNRRSALVEPPLSQSCSLSSLVVGAPPRCRGLDGLCLFVGERARCLQSLRSTADRWHHHPACTPGGSTSQHGPECTDTYSLGEHPGKVREG